MNKIKLLPKNFVDKIAAGEVVVNGASVLKELIENSIDAGTKNINITIVKGGKSLIKVQDDGEGIAFDDIPLAFKRNATSKITDSIDSISTLGFRGEALASIAFVSKIILITKTKDDECGTKTFLVNAEIQKQEPCACNNGTTMEISDLFYNIPARRKHLESDRSETSEIIDLASKLALSHPEISMRLICDGKEIFHTKSTFDEITNLKIILGKEIVQTLIPINVDEDPLFCKGYVSSPNFINEKHSQRITFINGRYVKADLISNAIDSVYYELYGKKGADYILFIQLPYYLLDVNIHPAKTKIKLQNESLIILLLKQGIKNYLNKNFILKNDIGLKQDRETKFESMPFEPVKDLLPETANAYFDNIKPDVTLSAEESESVYAIDNDVIKNKEKDAGAGYLFNDDNDRSALIEPVEKTVNINKEIFLTLKNMKYVGNAFGVYAMFEAGENLYAIDTHAAHERVLYDKYMTAFKNHALEIQTLMTPVLMNLGVKDYKTVIDNADKLERIGFLVDDLNDGSIAVNSVPYYVAGEDIKTIFHNLIEELDKTKNISMIEDRNERVISAACHNAIRGQENISEEESRALLNDLYFTQMPFTCPHGRPVIGRINIRYFMKAFERI